MKRIASLSLAAICLLAISCGGNNHDEHNTADTTATSASNTPATSPGSTAGFKIGIQMWTFRMFSLADALNKADSAGVKNIEAFFGQKLGGDMKGEFGTEMSKDTRDKLKKLLQSKGIQITAMGVISPKDSADWRKAFDLAKEFGLSYITCEPNKKHWDMVDKMAGEYGIKLAIHDHPKPNAYSNPDSVLAAIKGHPNIGACADIGHWTRNGLNAVDCLKQLEGHIYGVHLKDVIKFDDTHAPDTVVGKGIIDFPAVFAELKRQNFNGMMSIEQESNWYHNVTDVIGTVKYYRDQVGKLQ